MMDGQPLNPIRRIYRRHFARFFWARLLKGALVKAWIRSTMVRGLLALTARRVARGVILALASAVRVFGRVGLRASAGLRRAAQARYGDFRLLSFEDFVRETVGRGVQLAKAESVVVSMPEVYPGKYKSGIVAEAGLLDVPCVRALELRDVEVMGSSDFLFTAEHCIHHGLYRFERDLPAEIMHGMLVIDIARRRAVRYPSKEAPHLPLNAGMSLLGSASSNYVHWLTETLPKLALADEIPEFHNLPLLIDRGLHPNIVESLDCVNVSGRSVWPIGRGQICAVGRLVAISPTAYVPFDYRPGVSPESLSIRPDWAMFVPRGIRAVREKVLRRVSLHSNGRRRRIFVVRNSRTRQVRNAREVEAAMRTLGFEAVEPASMSFSEQVRIFSSAETIVAQAGAALGNMLFAPRGCHVVILSAWSRASIYYYFSNLASILDQRCTYVLSDPPEGPGEHAAHRELEVDVSALMEVIAR